MANMDFILTINESKVFQESWSDEHNSKGTFKRTELFSFLLQCDASTASYIHHNLCAYSPCQASSIGGRIFKTDRDFWSTKPFKTNFYLLFYDRFSRTLTSFGVLEVASDFRNELDFCESSKKTSPFDCAALKGIMSGSRSDHCTKQRAHENGQANTFTQSLNFQAGCIQSKFSEFACLWIKDVQEATVNMWILPLGQKSSTRHSELVAHLEQESVMKKLAFSRPSMQSWILLIGSTLGLISIALESFSCRTKITSKIAPLVPALFIFGDSLADPGNNNHLLSLAKANRSPYGRQFDTHTATGRFTNGRTALDFLTAELKLPLVPPFMDPATKGSRILQGVNYASAGSGILNSTGRFFGEIITMWKQLEHFRDRTQPEVNKLLGDKDGKEFFRKSI